MNKQQSISSENNINQKQNQYVFNIDQQRTILISSDFESGNIRLVKQINELYYILESLPDIENTSSKKSWFYFKIKSQKGIKVRLMIQNVNIYETIFEEKNHCKVMMKQSDSTTWIESPQSFFSYMDDLSVIIDHTFKNSQPVYFSLSVPFTYTQNNIYLEKLKLKLHPNIKYKDEILTLTPKGNQVHIITITELSHNTFESKSIIPQQNKPLIFITARVHPGEVSSSFCIQGILQFLLSYNNLQAYILRRLFIFKIVPMLNPDGVIEGNYRMDPQGFNLNRFYLEPNKDQHPAIHQILELIKKLGVKQKIEYYFDLHSHSSIKEAFIYGNAFQEIVNQTYSQMFCKILQENYPRFRNGLSNFGEQHMKHKDKGESLTKQGCGRVVISKLCGVIPSYTVQSSIFPSSYRNFMHKNVKSSENNMDYTFNSNENNNIFSFQSIYQTRDNNQNIIITENKRLGKALLVSILDMINKNPYSRLKQNYNEIVCKEIASKLLQTQDRFKLLDMKVNQKVKMIQHFIRQKFQNSLNKQWNLTGVYQEINNGDWPPNFKPITIFQQLFIRKSKPTKMRIRTQGRQKIDVSSSLNKNSKQTRIHTHKKIDIRPIQSHRSISPKHPIQTFFPEIKYSVEMKVANAKPIFEKVGTVKQMNLNFVQEIGQTKHIKKRMIIDFINDEMTKITPDKQLFKKNNASLNRLVCSKIMEKQKHKSRKSQLNDYKNIVVESRKRITTECNEEKDSLIETKIKQKTEMGEEQFKGLELKKAQIIKKRFLATNKAIEILKRNQKSKLKLPEVNKLNLVIQNTRKDHKNIEIGISYEDRHLQSTIQK